MHLFIHNPKTAGTSLIGVLKDQIYFSEFIRVNPTKDIHPKEFLKHYGERIKKIPESTLLKTQMIGGHFAFGAHEFLDNNDYEYVTVLRDPVDRVISEYFFMKQMGYYHQDDIINNSMSIESYLSHPSTFYLNNLQTRLISGVSYEVGDEVTEEIYQKALYNLNNFKSVGLTEKFAQTLALFYIQLNWKRIPMYNVENANKDRPADRTIESSTKEKIIEREQYDIRLYNHANQLFEENIRKNNDRINDLYDKIINPSFMYRSYVKSLSLYNKVKSKLY